MISLAYCYRNVLVRWKTTSMTVLGFSLVIGLFVVMLAFVAGVKAVCVVTGEPENVLCLAEGKTDEVVSQLNHRLAYLLETAPGVSRDENGHLLASRELFVVISQKDEKSNQYKFLQARGVFPVACKVHSQMRVVRGRMFNRHHREVIVGADLARSEGIEPGDKLAMGGSRWKVAGVFELGGSAFESEIWCDYHELASQFRRSGSFTSVVLQTGNALAAKQTAEYLNNHRRFDVEAAVEADYYLRQAELVRFIYFGTMGVAAIMGVGAVLGLITTMFAAISHRTKDIAVLQLLGFPRWRIVGSFLIEAQLIGFSGGLLGSLCAYATTGVTLSTAVGGGKQVAFAFRIDATTLLTAAIFAVVMGFAGGIFPAISATRVKPQQALS